MPHKCSKCTFNYVTLCNRVTLCYVISRMFLLLFQGLFPVAVAFLKLLYSLSVAKFK